VDFFPSNSHSLLFAYREIIIIENDYSWNIQSSPEFDALSTLKSVLAFLEKKEGKTRTNSM